MIGAITAGLFSAGTPAVTNSYESIATVTVGSGGVANIEFTSIPSTYKHLQIRGFSQINRATYPIDDFGITVNSDTANNYTSHVLYGDGASAGAYASAPRGNYWGNGLASTDAGSGWTATVLDFLDYANSNKYKTLRWLGGWDTNGTVAGYGGRVGLASGVWMNTNAISSVKITPVNGNFNQHTKFALYGIKG